MARHVIYILIDPITLITHYLGYSSNTSNRLRNHKYNKSGTTAKRVWIARLKKQGLNPIMQIIKEYETAEELPKAEEYWYAFFVSNGAELYNEPGYIGTGSLGHSKETRDKISKAQIGKILSDEHKKKLSIAHTGKKATQATKQKMSENRKGKKNPNFGKSMSEEQKQILKIVNTGRQPWNANTKGLVKPNSGSFTKGQPSAHRKIMNADYKNIKNQYNLGVNTKQIAENYNVNRTTIQKIIKIMCDSGELVKRQKIVTKETKLKMSQSQFLRWGANNE